MVLAGSASLVSGMLPAGAQSAAAVKINGGGDTFVVPLLNSVGPALGTGSPPVELGYLGLGSDQLAELIAGKLDFAVSDVPLTAEEAAALSKRTPYAYAPIAAGPLVFMYNLTTENNTAEKAEQNRITDLQLSPRTQPGDHG